VNSDGTTKHLALSDYRVEVLDRWKSPKSGANYPMKWKVAIPSEGIELQIDPEFSDQELITNRSTRVTYWEGTVNVIGKSGKTSIKGEGYVEMTGYAGKLNI
jgi:predicted secreted hydrolase